MSTRISVTALGALLLAIGMPAAPTLAVPPAPAITPPAPAPTPPAPAVTVPPAPAISAPVPMTSAALTDADIETIRFGLRADKRQTTAETLALTKAEAARFWPIYDRYIADLTLINDAKYALIQEYSQKFGSYSDKQATDFIRRWLDVDIKASQLRSRYVPIVGKVLPGVKMASFFQIDRRLALLVNIGLASQLPTLQSQDGN